MKEFLSFQKVHYEELDITKDSEARKRMINEYNSYSTPTVIVGGVVIRGFNLEKLEQVLNE